MERSAILRAIEVGGLEPPSQDSFEINGDDPLAASPHLLGSGAATARLLTGLAASELWHTRTGRRQQVSVDMAHATAALRSFGHLRLLDRERDVPLDARRNLRFTRIVPAAEGRFIQLHGSFHDGPQILEELGLGDEATAEDIDKVVAGRDAFELEAAFIRRRICGGVVLTGEEWKAHPQAQALEGLPVVRVTRIGDAPPEPLPDGDRPLSGVRVLDLTRVLAGPTCAKTLAEHGADVLHITSPKLGSVGPFDVETGIGKRQAHIDLDEAEDRARLDGLVRTADVFSQGYRLGTLARRGLSPERLADLRPGLVYVSENCYGPVGPWAERPGWEQLAQAATGMSHAEGEAIGRPPQLAPAAVNDYTTGFLAAYGAMVALARRVREGGSWLVQTSLSQTSMWYRSLGQLTDFRGADTGDVTGYCREMDTDHYGRIRYLAPALSLSETEPRWDLPPSPHGAHEPVWLSR